MTSNMPIPNPGASARAPSAGATPPATAAPATAAPATAAPATGHDPATTRAAVAPVPAGLPSSPLSPLRSAVLDEAHLGDIQGAMGTIVDDEDGSRRILSRRLKTLLAIIGPV